MHDVKVWVHDKIELLMLVTIPVLALLLRVVFRRNLAEHLAFAYFILGGVYTVQTLLMPVTYLVPMVALVAGSVPLVWFGWAAIRFNQTSVMSGLVRCVPMVLCYFLVLELGQHLVAILFAVLDS